MYSSRVDREWYIRMIVNIQECDVSKIKMKKDEKNWFFFYIAYYKTTTRLVRLHASKWWKASITW